MSEKNNDSQTDQFKLMSKADHLLKIAQNKVGTDFLETVNARELYAFLEVGRDYSSWIKNRIEGGMFEENRDYVIDSPNLVNQSGRGGDRRSKEYYISLDMAKHLAMLERNERGSQARELHAFLGVGKDFSTWIRDRIEVGILVENQDIIIFPNFRLPDLGGIKLGTLYQ